MKLLITIKTGQDEYGGDTIAKAVFEIPDLSPAMLAGYASATIEQAAHNLATIGGRDAADLLLAAELVSKLEQLRVSLPADTLDEPAAPDNPAPVDDLAFEGVAARDSA